ncbi:MAG: DNA/RNA non-specific endonuclease [bacterium]|nr:DNA/RNA non-specific endonuclease [bacterium]
MLTSINNNYNAKYYTIDKIPEYQGKSYVVIKNNEPDFLESDLTTNSFEKYSDLDSLGRCGIALANIGIDIMPTEERGNIGNVKPSGWHTVKYDIINGKYLYNRCHLIGYQLTGENANKKNLITCTRYMNTEGMLDLENNVAAYIRQTKNHVLYRVTPIFEGNDLLARGVQMEALSIEDGGEGIKFNIFVYNVQDGITIDYSTGESKITK